MKIHFGSFDSRFCGTKEQQRRFTIDENEVTCQECKDNDHLVLTPQGAAWIAAQRAAR